MNMHMTTVHLEVHFLLLLLIFLTSPPVLLTNDHHPYGGSFLAFNLINFSFSFYTNQSQATKDAEAKMNSAKVRFWYYVKILHSNLLFAEKRYFGIVGGGRQTVLSLPSVRLPICAKRHNKEPH